MYRVWEAPQVPNPQTTPGHCLLRHVISRRGLRSPNGRLIQVGCVGAHRRAPYKPLTNRGLWAHICAPLPASIKVKLTVEKVFPASQPLTLAELGGELILARAIVVDDFAVETGHD